MKLYEIDQKIAEIFDNMTVDEETGEVILDAEALEALQMARAEKLEGAALAVKNLESEAAAIEAEEKKLAARKTAAKNRAKSIREWIAYNIGTDKLVTPRVSMSVQPGVSSAKIDDVRAVIDWYNKTRNELLDKESEETDAEFDRITELTKLVWPDPEVSKAGIKKLLKDYEIPGVHLEDGKPILTIR